MFVICLRVSIPFLTNGGGMLPLSTLVSGFVAYKLASDGVTPGFVMYLCLNLTVSDPHIPLVSGNHP